MTSAAIAERFPTNVPPARARPLLATARLGTTQAAAAASKPSRDESARARAA